MRNRICGLKTRERLRCYAGRAKRNVRTSKRRCGSSREEPLEHRLARRSVLLLKLLIADLLFAGLDPSERELVGNIGRRNRLRLAPGVDQVCWSRGIHQRFNRRTLLLAICIFVSISRPNSASFCCANGLIRSERSGSAFL